MSRNFYKDRKVLVTGAAGLIGSHTAAALAECGAIVRAAYHEKEPELGGRNVERLQCELMRAEDCRKAARGMEFVFHCAAVTAGALALRRDPVGHVNANLQMSALMLEAAHREGAERFLYVSSATLYPESDTPLGEERGFEGDPCDACFGVGWLNRYIEKLAEFYFRRFGMKIALVRATSVYGPRGSFDPERAHVLPALIRKAIERQTPFEVLGDGRESRDFVYVEDVARALLAALEKAADGRPVNFGSGEMLSVRRAVEIVLRVAGHSRAEVSYGGDDRAPVIVRREVKLDRAREVLGIEAKVNLIDGLQRTVDWYLSATELE